AGEEQELVERVTGESLRPLQRIPQLPLVELGVALHQGVGQRILTREVMEERPFRDPRTFHNRVHRGGRKALLHDQRVRRVEDSGPCLSCVSSHEGTLAYRTVSFKARGASAGLGDSEGPRRMT